MESHAQATKVEVEAQIMAEERIMAMGEEGDRVAADRIQNLLEAPNTTSKRSCSPVQTITALLTTHQPWTPAVYVCGRNASRCTPTAAASLQPSASPLFSAAPMFHRLTPPLPLVTHRSWSRPNNTRISSVRLL